jgi:SAM-dependent methyltransferase
VGLGPPILALYTQLKRLGVFDNVSAVMELGAQNVWCPRPHIVYELFTAFGKAAPDAAMVQRFADWKGSARELHAALGLGYACIDLDPSFDSLPLDLNFDETPAEHVGRYDLVTNHGTSEHIMNQYNVFKMMHDLTRPGGYMLHAVPFTVHLEHGFFNYQPNFFQALARYNGYKTVGLWVGPDWQLASLVPWEPSLLDYLVLNAKTTHLLVAMLQRVHETPFCVPFQSVYEGMIPDEAAARYSVIVDGEMRDGRVVKTALAASGQIPARGKTIDQMGGYELLAEFGRRVRKRLPFKA